MGKEQHTGCGWIGCEGVDFGPVPKYSVLQMMGRDMDNSAQVDFELRIREHDKVQGHEVRNLVWKEPPS